MKIKLLLLFCLCSLGVSGQNLHWGLLAGPNYGGPIPRTLNPDSSTGTPWLSATGGAVLRYELSPKFSLQAELSFTGKGADYSQWYHRDTLVALELIPGRIDTVPTYYRADIAGRMRLGYLDLPILLNYHPTQSMRLGLGLQASYLVSGRDTGTVKVQIGDGALFDDEYQQYDNFGEMLRLGLGLTFQAAYTFPFGLEIGIKADRSLTRLYQKGFLEKRGFEDNPLYQTQFAFRLGYFW